ncbi:MAG: hypothetical protein IJ060_05525 [Oscillospiraceae bacterium]|nr:hypothetical protein [Oscillospiraceae bacterium]
MYSFDILGCTLEISQEKVDYIRLRNEFQRHSDAAVKEMKGLLPKSKSATSGTGMFSELAGIAGVGINFKHSLGAALGGELFENIVKRDYQKYDIFQKKRNVYVAKYLELVKARVDAIVEELDAKRIYVDQDALFLEAISNSPLAERMDHAVDEVIRKRRGTEPVLHSPVYDDLYKKAKLESGDMMHGKKETAVVYEAIIAPLTAAFLRLADTLTAGKFLSTEYKLQMSDVGEYTERACGLLFSIEDLQDALTDSLGDDVYRCFKMKSTLFSENGLAEYEIITSEENERAESLINLWTKKNIPQEDEIPMMVEALACNPLHKKYYYAILDKYYDQNRQLQDFADLVEIDIASHIESSLHKIYDDGDIGTLESTLELKEQILEAEAKYAYKDSKAYKDVLYRQHFLELSRKANEMDRDTIVSVWQSIQDGSNTFAGDERNDVGDDACILILKRRFLHLCAAEYHDVIRDLGLTDDQSKGEKNYAFYEEGEDYLAFEEECFKIINKTLERDENFAVQNYGEETLASGEVILGYFHYTRAMDIITDGKCLLITNQRIYTTKEKFTGFDQILTCKPTKKLLVTSLVLDKTDGTAIELPVSKEIAVPAADMINRLIAALKKEEYVANSVELTDSKAIAATKSTLLGAASSAKKGLSSLFGKKKQGDSDKE